MNFKILVRVELMKRGLTMKWLSEELGISQAYLSDILNGNRQGDKYRCEIKKLLNVEEE